MLARDVRTLVLVPGVDRIPPCVRAATDARGKAAGLVTCAGFRLALDWVSDSRVPLAADRTLAPVRDLVRGANTTAGACPLVTDTLVEALDPTPGRIPSVGWILRMAVEERGESVGVLTTPDRADEPAAVPPATEARTLLLDPIAAAAGR